MPRRNQEATAEKKALETISTLIAEFDSDGSRLTEAQGCIDDIRDILVDEGYLADDDEIDEEDEDEEEAA